MDDLYAIVGVGRTDPPDAIDKKIKQELRTWQKRTNSPDLTKRQEAEKRVELLTQAREILTDDAKRAAYTRQLDAYLASGAAQQQLTPQAPGAGGNWLEQARTYLGRGDYNSVVYAAREARNTLGASAEVWSLLARGNAGLGNLRDALYEAQQAATLDQNNPEHRFDLATIYEDLEQWDQALATYQQVNQMTGGSEEADLGIASVYSAVGRYDQAIPVLERVHQQGSDKPMAAFYLADVLLAHAETIPVAQSEDSYSVTSPQEVAQMREVVQRVKAISDHPEIVPRVLKMEQYLFEMEARSLFGITMFGLVKMGFIWFGIAILLTIVGAIFDAAGLFFFIGLLALGGRMAYAINQNYMPQWRINAIIHRREQQQAQYNYTPGY